ncbi:MAG: ABC transporter permease subunit [Alphaproteobacteria bacterium]|nr:ABC transporter permease subunit [Alphaproteobacteria bacterium]
MTSGIPQRTPTAPGAPLVSHAVNRYVRWLGSQRDTLGTAIVVIAVLLAWQFFGGYLPKYIFPTIPLAIEKFEQIITLKGTYVAIGQTLVRILGGFAVSASFGIAFGILMAMSTQFNFIARPLIRLIMGVPALTWVLLGVIWFKNMELRVWFFMFIVTFPITALNTYDGVRAVPFELYQMTRSLRPTTAGLLRFLIIPAATPFIFSGLRLSLSFSGRIAVFAEAIAAGTGIGAEMMLTNQLFDVAGLIGWTFILIVVLSLMDGALEVLERRWFRWRREMKD